MLNVRGRRPRVCTAAMAVFATLAQPPATVRAQAATPATPLASPRSVASAAAARPLALADFYRLETAAAPAISPDGRWVAFVRTYTIEAENRRHSEVWIAPADGSSPARRLTHPSFSSTGPRWSPDGALLGFTSRRRATGAAGSESGTWFLRMDRPGGEAFQIAGVTDAPVFSPDNRWIAFTRPTPPAPAPRPAPASEHDRTLQDRFTGRISEWMGYRFDGRGYLPDPRDSAATPPRELYVVARDGGTPRRLTSLGVDVQGIAWRPDSRALAFVANTHQRDEHTYERADLWTATLDGAVRRLTDDGYDHDSPAWSPDGRTIVVRRQQGLSQVIASRQAHGAPTDLYRMPADSGALTNLTPSWDLLPGSPRLSPDGRWVYFDADSRGTTQLFRLPLAGGAVEQVTHGDRRLGGISFDRTFARVAYTAGDPTHPAEVFVARVDGGSERKLSALNDGLLAEVSLAPAERIRFASKDGTEIEGWVILPRGDQARAPHPLILNIHGGPHGSYGSDFTFLFQLQAAHGYAVLYTNPRGSTGYGEQFLWGTWGGWGNRDYEDVMAGVDHTLRRYPVDSARMGVTGYSYGGFLTDWIITQTPRFAAAVAGAGISNWISDYGTADIPRTKESEFFGTPWEERGAELLWKQSPLRYAKNVRTPTMFIHGEADLRVPIEQAEQMYTALQKLRVPARFVRYPDMYHGNWTPWNTVHRYDQELRWWTRWLREGKAVSSGAR